jgi:sRNA-binding carbon storage regulator CsrA
MPLNVRRKIGESIDIDESIRIFVDDISFDPVNRESNVSLRVIERDTATHLSHLLYERESVSLSHAGQGIEVRLLHVMSHIQCLLQVSAPQAVRILRTELLNRGVTHE